MTVPAWLSFAAFVVMAVLERRQSRWLAEVIDWWCDAEKALIEALSDNEMLRVANADHLRVIEELQAEGDEE